MSAKSDDLASRVGRELNFTRVFDAPRELVFKAWIDSKHLEQWFGPRDYTIRVYEANPRQGGAIRFEMRAPDGDLYSVTGVYREVVEAEKLVFSEAVGERGQLIFEILNTVTFTERHGKTTLDVTSRVIQAPVAMVHFVEGMEIGWIETLERLVAEVAKMSVDHEQPSQMPAPDPALKRLDPLVGTWDLKGRTPDTKEDNVTGRMTCEWLPGGFFVQQHSEIHFDGFKMQSLEIIGYDPSTDTFPSSVYSSMSGAVLPYRWNVQGNTVTHWKATDKYMGEFSEDGRTLTGGWRPIEGQQGGVTYDVVMHRLD